MSTARSATFAEAAERPNLYVHPKVLLFRQKSGTPNAMRDGCLLMHSVGAERLTSALRYPGSFRRANRL
jgi:hypothetical protein